MGTNYYAIPKVSTEYRKKIAEEVLNGDIQKAKQMIHDSIHIGKSSAGWKFVFNHNNWEYFNKSLESLELFLVASNIEDEYGTPITYQDFWKMVKDKESGIDNKEYFTNWDEYNKDFITGHPLRRPSYVEVDFGEEYHFGLRFLTSVEFS